jgi:hypothetical protein
MQGEDQAQNQVYMFDFLREISLFFLLNLFVCSCKVRYYAGAVDFAAFATPLREYFHVR